MKRLVAGCLCTAALFAASNAAAQTGVQPPVPVGAAIETAPPVSSFKGLFAETARDFTRLPSRDTARWLAIGTAAALAARQEDTRVGGMFARPELQQAFGSGQTLGSAPFQMGAAIAVFAIGRMNGNPRAVQVGGDLFRAQTVAQLTTYAIKYTTQRTRPDGTKYSFPSGHTSVTVASATVLQRNLGWKVGIPAYRVAAFVAGSRLQTKRHHLSDVAFGAALGIIAGRTVTVGRGSARMAVTPTAVPGGAAITFTRVGR
jgi:hypothetical protein